MMSLSILHVRNVVGLEVTCPWMACLNVCCNVVGHDLRMRNGCSFHMEQSSS